MKPYYSDGIAELYLGDFREVVPQLQYTFDLVIADPPYGETNLSWDVWPAGWPGFIAEYTQSMWCFGSMRMFLERFAEIDPYWNLSQDVVWEKHNGSGLAKDRFKRVHEHALHWYRGPWDWIHHEPPRVAAEYDPKGRTKSARRATHERHFGDSGDSTYVDDGLRVQRSVIYQRSMHGLKPINPTEKPVAVIEPLIKYGCPVNGVVLDPFAGSAATLVAARNLGFRVVGVELREEQCEKAANRLAQGVLDFQHEGA